MTLSDHLRLIWPQRPHILLGDQLVFDDGLPAPTQEELEATRAQAEALFQAERAQSLPTITARQLRLWLAGEGILTQVEGLIETMPEPQKTQARIEWEYSTSYLRTHPLVTQVGQALGLSASNLNDAWTAASQL